MIVKLFQVITIVHSVKVSLFTFMTKQDKARHDMTIQRKQRIIIIIISTIIIIIILRYVDLDKVGSRRICFNVSDFILCGLADIWFLSVVEIYTCTPVYNIRKLFITYFLVQAPKTDKQTNNLLNLVGYSVE